MCRFGAVLLLADLPHHYSPVPVLTLRFEYLGALVGPPLALVCLHSPVILGLANCLAAGLPDPVQF